MLVETELGAAQVVAAQAALALRPDAPQRFTVVTPPDPRQLRDQVSADVGMLFLLLAGVCLLIGAVGIANTTMVAVLERVPEIGLRRALGARPWHIAAQFLAESAAIGSLAGWVGAAVGAMTVVAVALAGGGPRSSNRRRCCPPRSPVWSSASSRARTRRSGRPGSSRSPPCAADHGRPTARQGIDIYRAPG
ncbi:ABC transporter permease [Catellatospora coxensis]